MKPGFKHLVLFLAICMASFSTVKTYAQGWLWGRGSGGATTLAWGAVADNDGNVFTVANCYGPMYGSATDVTFGSTVVPFSSYTSPPSSAARQVVWAKYSTAGVPLWAGGTQNGDCWLYNHATDQLGNLIVFGCFRSPTLQIGSVILNNPYYYDLPIADGRFFLAKFSPSGTCLWAIADGGMSHANYAGSVATDNSGNIYITASYARPHLNIGSFTLDNTDTTGSVTYGATDDIFVAKYSPGGVPVWATSIGGTLNDYPADIAVSSGGSVYICGNLTSPSITVGPSVIVNPYAVGGFVSPAPPSFAMIAKFSGISGAPVWAECAGGTRGAMASSLANDNFDNMYMTGNFKDTSITFGATTLTRPYPASTPYYNLFLVKYTAANTVAWGKVIGAASSNLNNVGVATSRCAVWVEGLFNGAAMVDGTIIPFPYTCCAHIFVAGFDHAGSLFDQSSLSSAGSQVGSPSCDADGNLYIGGSYSGSISIGPDLLNVSITLGQQHTYAGKYRPPSLCCDFASGASFTHTGIPSVDFNYTGAPGYDSLRWYFGDGSTSTDPNPTHVYTDSGTYIACLYAYFACNVDVTMGDCDTIVVPWKGQSLVGNSIAAGDNIELFPNPTGNQLTIKASTGKYNFYTITNTIGQVILSKPITQSETKVNTQSLAPGIHYLTLAGDKEIRVLKFVKN
jgi:hypothetical protein